jgi:hypothetical protein
MALFVIQLVRVVLSSLLLTSHLQTTRSTSFGIALDSVIGMHEMLNVIIRSVHFYFFCFTDNFFFTWLLGHRTDNNFGAGLNEIVLR